VEKGNLVSGGRQYACQAENLNRHMGGKVGVPPKTTRPKTTGCGRPGPRPHKKLTVNADCEGKGWSSPMPREDTEVRTEGQAVTQQGFPATRTGEKACFVPQGG